MKNFKRKSLYFIVFLLCSIPISTTHAMLLESFIAQYNPQDAPQITAAIYDSSMRHHIDPLLMASIFYVESRFDNRAVSTAGALGIAQLMPDTAEEMNVNPYGIRDNIEGGTKYMAEMMKRNAGWTDAALASYNAGPGNVTEGIPPYTYGYIQDVTDMYRKLRTLIPKETPHSRLTRRERLLKAIRKVQQENAARTAGRISPATPQKPSRSSIFY